MRLTGLFLLCWLASTPALAHDQWLQPDESRPTLGTPTAVRIFSADDYRKGEEQIFKAQRYRSLRHVSSTGVVDLLPSAVDGAKPVITLKAGTEGGHLVVMARKFSAITLPGWKFSAYLVHEEFQAALDARKASGDSWSEGKERYSRYIKTLLNVGTKTDDVYKAVLGLRYELVPLNDPSRVGPGETLVVRVLLDGEPLPGARVLARSMGGEKVEQRTDANGTVRLVLSEKDQWLVRSVFLRACGECRKSAWESFWGAYQFSNESMD